MNTSPTIERSVLTPIVGAIAEIADDVEQLLETTKLIQDWSDPTVSQLPEDRVWQLFDCASRKHGCPAIGLHAGAELQINNLGPFGRQLQNSLTLFHCLNKYNETVSRYSSHATFWLERQGDFYWFSRQGIDLITVGRDYVEQFTIQLMIRIIQLAGGSRWRPSHVRIQATSASPYREFAIFDDAEIDTNQAMTGIRVPVLLGTEMLLSDSVFPLKRQINKMLAETVDQYQVHIDDAANAMGVSRRTLQRRLAEHGSDWRELLEHFRFQYAIRMSAESDIKLIDLAHQLGYTDQANFGRAFRKWTGVAPGSYRQMRS